MCYHPVRILNPKIKSENELIGFDQSKDKLFLEVPCGHCGTCRQKQIDDYYVRTVSEYDECIKKGGIVFFNTFTYDPRKVPKYYDLKCFDSQHFIRFMKNLRSRIFNKYGKDSRSKLKNFWVSEYGSQTALPHYHSLFFITIEDMLQDGKSKAAKEFGELCEDVWDYGGTQTEFEYHNGKPNPYYKNYDLCLVTRENAINYVSKYVNKDLDFLTVINKQKTAPKFKEYVQQTRYEQYCRDSIIKLYGHDIADSALYDDYLDRELDIGMVMDRVQFDMFYPLEDISFQLLYHILPRNIYNQYLPFKRISQGYGIAILSNYSIEQLSKGYIVLPDKIKGEKKYRLPMYIDRKIFYDYDKTSKCFKLNDLGKTMKVVRIEYNTDYMQKVMSTFWRSWYLGITEDQCNSILDDLQFSINEALQSPSDIEDYIECLLDGRSWLEYLNYIMVYKDMIIPKDKGILQFDGAVSRNYDLVLNLGSSPDYLPKNISYFNCRDLNKFISGLYENSSCNCLVEFSGFDQISEIYNLIRAHISDIDQSEYERLQKVKSEEKYNNIIHSQKL